MSSPENLKNHESKNVLDRETEKQKLKKQLDIHLPEQSKDIIDQLNQLSPETLVQILPQIQKQVSILQGKQDFSNRQILAHQIEVLTASREEILPDFNLV